MLHTRWFPFLLVIIPLVLICTFERLNEILWSNDMLGWLNPFTWFWGGTFEWLVFSADYLLPCCLVPVQIMAPYYSFRQRSFLARTYHETQSYVEVSRRVAARYPRERRVPTKGCICTEVQYSWHREKSPQRWVRLTQISEKLLHLPAYSRAGIVTYLIQ